MDLVENADGTLSPPETDPGDVDASIGVCNAKNIIFVVSGSVAQSQAITCVTTLYEGETDTTQTTLTLDGGQLTSPFKVRHDVQARPRSFAVET